jgi:hypothetical protein
MEPYLNLLLVLVAVGLVRLLVLWLEGKRGATMPNYRRRVTLLTPAEQAFRDVLLRAIPDHIHVCYKVRLLDVIEGENPRDPAVRNKVMSKHLDYVLIESRSSRIVAAIELDNASHLRPDRAERDRFVEHAMRSAGVPLIRFRAAATYDEHAVASKLAEAYGSHPRPRGKRVA